MNYYSYLKVMITIFISRYKMCPLLIVSALCSSSNKMVTKITESSLRKPKHPEALFKEFVA